MNLGLHQALSGKVHCLVVDSKTKEVIKDYGWQKNLILNQGMNNYGTGAYSYLVTCFTVAVAGTGTTATQVTSGATTAAQSGTTVTLSGGSFTFASGDVGKTLKWGTSETALITAFTNSTTVTVNKTQTVSAGIFTMYNTQQTGLTTEVKRTNTYLTGPGNCESAISPSNVIRNRRTYDFTAEVGTVTYTEIGFSHISSVGSNLFSRVLLDTPVLLTSGQQLRVQYELTVTYTPGTPRSKSFDIPGWPVAPATGTAGAEGIDGLAAGRVGSSGGVTGDILNIGLAASSALEVRGASRIILTTNSTALNVVPTTTNLYVFDGGSIGVALATEVGTFTSYVSNSFALTLSATFVPTEGNSTVIRAIYLAEIDFNFRPFSIFRFLFSENQTKDNLHKLVVNLRWTWDRTL